MACTPSGIHILSRLTTQVQAPGPYLLGRSLTCAKTASTFSLTPPPHFFVAQRYKHTSRKDRKDINIPPGIDLVRQNLTLSSPRKKRKRIWNQKWSCTLYHRNSKGYKDWLLGIIIYKQSGQSKRDKFLETYTLIRLTHEDIGSLDRVISSKAELVTNSQRYIQYQLTSLVLWVIFYKHLTIILLKLFHIFLIFLRNTCKPIFCGRHHLRAKTRPGHYKEGNLQTSIFFPSDLQDYKLIGV